MKKLLILLLFLAGLAWLIVREEARREALREQPVLTVVGNQRFDSFEEAKEVALTRVYHDHHLTFYCAQPFNAQKQVLPEEGFSSRKFLNRFHRIEWEHVVPAEHFGRHFPAWKKGSSACLNKRQKKFYKGRKCAEKVSRPFRLMQADLYNLYPAVGSVNAARSNLPFAELPEALASDFGVCDFKITDEKAQPPARARGAVARTHLYFDAAYELFQLSDKDRLLMMKWDAAHPVDAWECLRAARIERIQKNENPFVKKRCVEQNLWPKGGL